MAYNEHDVDVEIEGTVERSTDKAWLFTDNMTGIQVWMPKSQAEMISEKDPEGNIKFRATKWWAKKAGLIT